MCYKKTVSGYGTDHIFRGQFSLYVCIGLTLHGEDFSQSIRILRVYCLSEKSHVYIEPQLLHNVSSKIICQCCDWQRTHWNFQLSIVCLLHVSPSQTPSLTFMDRWNVFLMDEHFLSANCNSKTVYLEILFMGIALLVDMKCSKQAYKYS